MIQNDDLFSRHLQLQKDVLFILFRLRHDLILEEVLEIMKKQIERGVLVPSRILSDYV